MKLVAFLFPLALMAQEGIPGPTMVPVPVTPAPILQPAEPPAPKPASFRLVVSHQPLEVFKAAFMEKLNNVALYDALVCNLGESSGSVSGGIVMQGAASKVSIINRGLVEITAMRARTKSKKYIAAEISKWAALVGATIVSGGIVDASTSVAVIFPLVASASDRLSKNFDKNSIPTAALGDWLAADESYNLAPKACTNRLFLGGFKPGFQSVTVELQ